MFSFNAKNNHGSPRSFEAVEKRLIFNQVKLLKNPETQEEEQYVLCRSGARHEKEAAMLGKQRERLRKKLDEIDKSLRKYSICHKKLVDVVFNSVPK